MRMIAHTLVGFNLQNYFSRIHFKNKAYVLCLDTPEADVRILKHYRMFGIKNYRTFLSNAPPPFPGITARLRIAAIFFTEFQEQGEEPISDEKQKEIRALVKARNPDLTDAEFAKLFAGMNPRFLRALTKERLISVLDMFFRALSRDACQYEVRYNEDWQEKKETPSMQIVLAWRNVPKHNFLYRLAQVIHRHGLILTRANASYIHPYSKNNILLMSLGLHGMKGGAAWEECDLADFLRELATVKYFEGNEAIETTFVDAKLVSGNFGNLLKTLVYFIHQALVHADPNLYSFNHIEEGLCRHPELTVQICEAFACKFRPDNPNLEEYKKRRDTLLDLIEKLDTGHEINDTRRKNIFKQGIHFVEYTLKTNFYRNNKTGFSFRLDAKYLDHLPFDRKEKFPELPFAIFFMKGMYYLGFHIRFKDLARGGLRTVFPEKMEQMLAERNNVFSECYALAYTQQKKNKDIPEGGAKGVILLEPYGHLYSEEEIYQQELQAAEIPKEEIEQRLIAYHKEQRLELLYQSQRSYVENFLTLVNCEQDGALKSKHIVDYWEKPEYIYLGPDENLHNEMITWIANYSVEQGYKPGGSFMSSKPGAGINHKEFGVTSFGVNVYMEEVLKYMGLDPHKQPFTIKMTGGPDGDVAGNQIYNLYRFYPKTAKLIALVDGSGTINDPAGLDLEIMSSLFKEGKPIRFYPPEKLSEGAFIIDTKTKREQSAYAQQTLCWRKKGGKAVEEWLSGNEMNHLLRHNVHQTKADIFIPAGGRPRTLNENNYRDFLDETGKPTSKAIIEGANLYLTAWARRALEKLGVLIIKDSSANKGGVICSSFEVLHGLCLSEEEFLKEKAQIAKEILQVIGDRSRDEAKVLLRTHKEKGAYLTDASEWVSERINTYMYKLLDHLVTSPPLSMDKNNPLVRCLLDYCPPLLRTRYSDRVLKDVPDVHKKAIISCFIASRLVYARGLDWAPSIVDILPLLEYDPSLIQ